MKSLRLKTYDYSQNGFYFITICTKDRLELFGSINDGQMVLNDAGKIADYEIRYTAQIRKYVTILNYCVMPDHVHILLEINNQGSGCKTPSTEEDYFWDKKTCLGKTINALKGTISRKIGFPLWQRSYYDTIIRDEEHFIHTHNYITENAMRKSFPK